MEPTDYLPVLNVLDERDVFDLLRYAICTYQAVAPCSPPAPERTAQLMRRGRAALTAVRDHMINTVHKLDADAAVKHAVDKAVGKAPSHPELIPAWTSWREAVHDLIHNGCRAVGIDQADAVEGAMTKTGYQRRTTGPLTIEIEALTAAGVLWHHTPHGVFWTDLDLDHEN
ncbi:hypothetical protein ACFXJO_16320 [Streptomyces lavendulae]|uniref:hypothetical protein n=1 Tax=Streptomyces lavendulae TaxID=1914 RepID=UPI00369452D6